MTAEKPDGTRELIGPNDFAVVADLLKKMCGIHLKPNKRAMVSGRLFKRLKASGISSVSAYCRAMSAPGNVAEQDAFISALTTNVTRFHREAHHFEHFREHQLPGLVRTARTGGRVRLWSAGCSTGEEAYDLAFFVLQACPEAARLDVRILATDIDKTALAKARDGFYPKSSLSQLPKKFATRFFNDRNAPEGMTRVRQAARDLIAFRWLNLNSDWPFQGRFDVIVCRNVAIYFDDELQARLWRRLASRVQPNGTLVLGHSESLTKDVLVHARQEGPGTYRFTARDTAANDQAGLHPRT